MLAPGVIYVQVASDRCMEILEQVEKKLAEELLSESGVA